MPGAAAHPEESERLSSQLEVHYAPGRALARDQNTESFARSASCPARHDANHPYLPNGNSLTAISDSFLRQSSTPSPSERQMGPSARPKTISTTDPSAASRRTDKPVMTAPVPRSPDASAAGCDGTRGAGATRGKESHRIGEACRKLI